MSFNASVFVSEQMSRQLCQMSQDLAHRCVYECAQRYGFDGEEAVRMLNLSSVKVERKVVKAVKASVAKAAFPLPYSGEFVAANCYALRQNNGLYTQCSSLRKGEADFCKSCVTLMHKTGAEFPEYGTIQQRMAVGIFEFVDPKGRRPVSYTKVMKKYKISQEQVMEEAGKYNINIDLTHFVESEKESKRGRPSSQKEKEPKEKGAKGRPKKEKRVIEIEGDDEDLFATLVAQANESDELVMPKKKVVKSDEEKEAERLAKEQEKAEREAKLAEAKAEKEAKLAAEKAEKEAKLAAAKAEKEAKLAAEKAEKEMKKLALEQAKAEKEAKLAAEKAEKEAKKLAAEEAKAKKPSKKVVEPEEDEEPDVVKKIEFDGKKYLKSKKTGIVYDYNEYVKNGEQVVVGKWNENSNKIDFDADEEEEEEYDM